MFIGNRLESRTVLVDYRDPHSDLVGYLLLLLLCVIHLPVAEQCVTMRDSELNQTPGCCWTYEPGGRLDVG